MTIKKGDVVLLYDTRHIARHLSHTFDDLHIVTEQLPFFGDYVTVDECDEFDDIFTIVELPAQEGFKACQFSIEWINREDGFMNDFLMDQFAIEVVGGTIEKYFGRCLEFGFDIYPITEYANDVYEISYQLMKARMNAALKKDKK